MSYSTKKQNKPKKKEELPKNWNINHSDFREKMNLNGANSRLSYLYKPGPRDVGRPGHTLEVRTEGNSMANYSGNVPSTSGESHKGGQITLGSLMSSLHDANQKLSFTLKQQFSPVVKTNALDCISPRVKKVESSNKCANEYEVGKKTKRKKKRSKNNSLQTLQTNENPPSPLTESAAFIKIISNPQIRHSSLDVRSNPCSQQNITAQALLNKYNPFGSGKCKSSSEIMKALVGLNPGKHFKRNTHNPAPTTSSSGDAVVDEASSPHSGMKRTINANRKRRVPVNIAPEKDKKDLSQAALINRYNRAHPNKIRDLKEKIQKDPLRSEVRCDRACANQDCDYLRVGKPYYQSCIKERNQSNVGSSTVELKSQATHGILARRPLSASRFSPPPVIDFTSSSPCSVPGSSSGNEVHSKHLLPDHGGLQEEACMEWEDIEDEKVLQNIKVHRQCYQDLENLNEPIEDMETNILVVSQDNSEDCLIVLDTNILLSHLNFVAELSIQEYKAVGCPILVIPWRVLKELDAFKGGRNRHKVCDPLQIKARSAARFINSSFSCRHPRIKGQSALDDREHCIAIDVPDDSILNCCLQLQMKGKRVILLSNDVNFCNKAMATGILAYGREQMNKALILGTLDFGAVEHRSLLHGSSSSQTEAEKRYDKTVLKFKILFHEFLSRFIEAEMKRVYKDLWIKVILLKPPWSLQDSLRNISKHWVAVFGFVMNKSGQKVVEDLICAFKTEGSSTGSPLLDTEKVIQSAVDLCGTIIADNYQDLALEYKNSFMCVLKVLKECKTGDIRGASVDQAQPKSSTQVPQFPTIQPDKCPVFETFQFMWNLVNNFCGIVCDTFGIEHGISYEKPETFPSVEEVKGRMPEASQYVDKIITCISSILETPATQLSVEHPTILSLHMLIQFLVPSEFLVHKDITCEKLLMFCIGDSTRMMLVNGTTQFKEAQMLLLKVLNYIG